MIAGLVLIATAGAQTVTFDLNTDRAHQLGIDPDAAERDLSTSVEKDLGLVDPSAYLHRFARAAAVASKGMGVDYASHPKVFSTGLAVGTAVSGIPLTFRRGDDVPESGFSFQASAYGGINLGALQPGDENFLDRFRLYVSGMGLKAPSDYALEARLFNFGIHTQVVILRPVGEGLAEWGGLELTAGYERILYELDLAHELPLSHDIGGVEATWVADGVYTIRTHVDSIPLELSTSFRAAPLTLYGGLGLDIDAAAGSEVSVSLAGPVDVVVERNDEQLGTGAVALDSGGDANGGQFRGFVGFQINIFAFKIFGHMNVGVDQTYGAFAGVRAAL